MRKLGLLVKEVSSQTIRKNIQETNSVFIIKYLGMSSSGMSDLRKSLSGVNASLFVVRNKIAMRALKDLGREDLNTMIDGPCGFVFFKDEPVSVSKVLWDFFKTHEQLKIEGGLLQNVVLDSKSLEALSKLPSKEVLRAQVVSGIKAPITSFVMVLGNTLRKLVICLDQVKQKKEKNS